MTAIASDMARLARILCALALLCVGLAHRPPVIETDIPLSEIASYRLPDGSLPVLCIPGADESGKQHKHDPGIVCEACRITASVALPSPADTIGQALAVAIEARLPIRREAFYRQLFAPSARPRGPPSGLIA